MTDVKGFTIDGMTIRDSKGDLIKITKAKNVVISNLHAIWRNAADSVRRLCYLPCPLYWQKNTLAIDAGIYIGQSQGAIVEKLQSL